MDMDTAIICKMQRYCAYQERSESEVRKKLISFKLNSEEEQAVLEHLRANHFFDNERFAEIYVKSKLAQAWGGNKIKAGLLQKEIPKVIIQKCLEIIPREKTLDNITKLTEKWLKNSKKEGYMAAKLFRYLYGRGFDAADITEVLKTMDYKL